MVPEPLTIVLGYLAVVAVLDLLEKFVGYDEPSKWSREGAVRAYQEGEIDERELERRLEVALDPAADELRQTAESVSGIGPETSAAIAAHPEFRTIEDVRDADEEELENVDGIGEQYAEALSRL